MPIDLKISKRKWEMRREDDPDVYDKRPEFISIGPIHCCYYAFRVATLDDAIAVSVVPQLIETVNASEALIRASFANDDDAFQERYTTSRKRMLKAFDDLKAKIKELKEDN